MSNTSISFETCHCTSVASGIGTLGGTGFVADTSIPCEARHRIGATSDRSVVSAAATISWCCTGIAPVPAHGAMVAGWENFQISIMTIYVLSLKSHTYKGFTY